MMKMLITLDEDKIQKEGKYDLKKINSYLETSYRRIRGRTGTLFQRDV